MLKKIFDFLLFSSLYIAVCAVVMVYQTQQLILQDKPSTTFLFFVFFSTICSYNFHWFLTPGSVHTSERVRWSQQHKGWHFTLYLFGLVGAGICFFYLWQHWLAMTFAGFLTFLYSAPKIPQTFFRQLKNIAIGKTIFLAFVWMYVTTVLPILVAGNSITPLTLLFACSRFFLIYAICLLFDYRDRDDDKAEGIRSMITYFNEKGINRIFYCSLVLFSVTTFCMHTYGVSWKNIFLLLLPGLILAVIYQHAKKSYSDYLYYFILDGLMMLSALLMLVAKI